MKTLLLHIGSYKTGSTSIQSAIGRFRRQLFKQGVYVPKAGAENGSFAHHNWARGIRGAAWSPPLGELEAQLQTEIRSMSCSSLLMSSETFFAKGMATAMRDLFPKFEVKVICYLRPQVEFFSSFYYQLVKHERVRECRPPSIDLLRESPATRYLEVLLEYIDAFGASNIKVVPFKSGESVDQVESFFDKIDIRIPDRSIYKNPELANATIATELIEYLRLFNSFSVDIVEHKRMLEALEYVDKLSRQSKSTFFRYSNAFSPSERGKIHDLHYDENRKIAQMFPDYSLGDDFFNAQTKVEDVTDWRPMTLQIQDLSRITAGLSLVQMQGLEALKQREDLLLSGYNWHEVSSSEISA